MSKSGERYKSAKQMKRHEATESMKERIAEYGPKAAKNGGKWCRKNCK